MARATAHPNHQCVSSNDVEGTNVYGMDGKKVGEIDHLIIDLNKKLGITSVVVTHEMDSAFRIADRMVLLDRGKFIISGTADEMRNSTDPLVRQFVHGLAEGPLTQRRRTGTYEVDLLGRGLTE